MSMHEADKLDTDVIIAKKKEAIESDKNEYPSFCFDGVTVKLSYILSEDY